MYPLIGRTDIVREGEFEFQHQQDEDEQARMMAESDWADQSPRMADIYSNAYLAITAAGSDGIRGFLKLGPGLRWITG